ncbi:hypothetical protein SCP_0501360 [Sparassis crispa]|uniref:F-box domain-containing protein n=1 Tax=Sparassis crispa TaxID=139825 RepID=A0A401GLQ3_9APHY|nr:hypothetical protein SCP_0501360 [Sparassis crispa]GBE83090.1 hypothetical protein SCP_0501360 [Sparassis crispa]
MEPSPPALPIEIFDNVLDHLWDDPHVLAACSLASRMLLSTSRFHLFNTISLDDPAMHDLFYRLLKASPAVSSYVRHLSVDQRAVRRKGSPRRADLELILPKPPSALDRVHHLTLKNFSALELSMQSKLDIQASFPGVRTLSFMDCKFDAPLFVDVLHAFPKLSELHLHLVQVGDRRTLFNFSDPDVCVWLDNIPFTTMIPSSETLIQIDALSTSLTSPIVGNLLSKSPFKLSPRRLEITCFPSQTRCVRALLHTSGLSLEHATFSASSRNFLAKDTMPSDFLDFSCNKELVSLHMNGVLIDTWFTPQSQWAHSALSSIGASHESLREIQIDCMLLDCAQLPLLRWNRFDDQFARLAREHPGVKFTLRIRSSYAYHEQGVKFHVWARQVVDAVGDSFPILLAEKSCLLVACYQARSPAEEVVGSFPQIL